MLIHIRRGNLNFHRKTLLSARFDRLLKLRLSDILTFPKIWLSINGWKYVKIFWVKGVALRPYMVLIEIGAQCWNQKWKSYFPLYSIFIKPVRFPAPFNLIVDPKIFAASTCGRDWCSHLIEVVHFLDRCEGNSEHVSHGEVFLVEHQSYSVGAAVFGGPCIAHHCPCFHAVVEVVFAGIVLPKWDPENCVAVLISLF